MHARLLFTVVLGLGVTDLGLLDLALAPRLAALRAPPPGPRASVEARPAPPAPPSSPSPRSPAPAPESLPGPAPAPAVATQAAVAAMPDIELDLDRTSSRNINVLVGLRGVVAELRADPKRRLLIRGHSDRLGAEPYRLTISRRRAEATARYLVARGAPRDRIDLEAVGAAEPADPGDNPTAWAHNRRVQVLWR